MHVYEKNPPSSLFLTLKSIIFTEKNLALKHLKIKSIWRCLNHQPLLICTSREITSHLDQIPTIQSERKLLKLFPLFFVSLPESHIVWCIMLAYSMMLHKQQDCIIHHQKYVKIHLDLPPAINFDKECIICSCLIREDERRANRSASSVLANQWKLCSVAVCYGS